MPVLIPNLDYTDDSMLSFTGIGEGRDHGYDRRMMGRHWVKTGEYYITKEDEIGFITLFLTKDGKTLKVVNNNY